MMQIDPETGEMVDTPDVANAYAPSPSMVPAPGTPGLDPHYFDSPLGPVGSFVTPPDYNGTGSPQPGWTQGPSGGWTYADPTTTPPPTTQPPPNSGGGGGGGGGGTGGGGGDAYSPSNAFTVNPSFPQFHAPDLPTFAPFSFSYDSYKAPDPYQVSSFTPDKFSAPTLADAQNEPGYAFARDEGIRALENSASAKGVTRTGGTLKDILGWGDKFAEQNYGNVYNRAANTFNVNEGAQERAWSGNEGARSNAYAMNAANGLASYNTNRNNAYDVAKTTYGLNTGTALDLYDRNFQGKLAEFNPQFSAASQTFDALNQRQRDLLNSLTQITAAGAGGA